MVLHSAFSSVLAGPVPAQVPVWTPSRKAGAPRRAAQCAVKPLFDTCLSLVVDYIDDVESLWGLPDAIKVSSR